MEKIFDFNALLDSATPAQLFMVFILPIFLYVINKRLVGFLMKKYKLANIETPELAVVNHTQKNTTISQLLTPALDIFAKIFRPLLIVVFLLYVSLQVWVVWNNVGSSAFIRLINALYLVYFIIALAYNFLMLSKKSHGEFRTKVQTVLTQIFIPITYVHLFALLYFLVCEHFFNLIVYSSMVQGLPSWSGVLVLCLFPIPAIVVLRDMLQSRPQGIQSMMAFLLSSCIICYLFLIAGFCYKTF